MRILAWPAFRKEAANPHAALLARALIAEGATVEEWTPVAALIRPGDLWHLHHPETVLYRRAWLAAWAETIAFLILFTLARLRGTRMVWAVHDLGSNDRLHPRLEALFWRRFVAGVDGVISLAETGRRDTLIRFPELAQRSVRVIPHGHYADAYPSGASRAVACRHLGLDPDCPVILHFGLIRPYKNVPHLITTFVEMKHPAAQLVVAGRPFDDAIEREVREVAEGAGRLFLNLGWIPEEEMQHYLAAADLVVLPYREVTNSGAIFLALSFSRPVLVPDRGAMAEHLRQFGPDWVRLYSDELTSADLDTALDWAALPRTEPDLTGMGWDSIARETLRFYAEVAGGRADLATGFERAD